MEKISLETRGKINLTLDIVNKREDGYHDVSMIMQSITLHDTLHFQVIENDIKITCDNRYLPTDGRNIVYKAAQLLKNKYNISSGIEVFIEKRIPFAAGLAGGSSNAAGTIIALNKLWDLNLEDEVLLELGKNIGADVPFCMTEGTALAEGVGERLTQIDDLPQYHIVLVKPDIRISTPWAYGLIDVKNISKHPDNLGMIAAIEKGNRDRIASKLSNVFEDVIFARYPQLQNIKERLHNLGSMGELMSGSGPTLYGLFNDELQAMKAKEALLKDYKEVFIAKSYNKGGLLRGF